MAHGYKEWDETFITSYFYLCGHSFIKIIFNERVALCTDVIDNLETEYVGEIV